ncbi:DUF1249 domain-containing protein [Haliea sp. AH-315-K21]|uniref:Cytoplasmic protein n=1 Tax=SAR86 cluster bacterium TaxID=2030880 RepID=A0A2A5CI38_9GAMM|nr:DUF1249 domain-containing protein [Haliea sp. AH-315-K21]PCJ43423.1 MAG: hypothetical protein COA71_00690 [SAR86 cluster bacterium]
MNVKRPYSIDLSAQMAVCDANFIRMLQLLPNLRLGLKREISFTNAFNLNAQELGVQGKDYLFTTIEVIERFKYTSTIRIVNVCERPDIDTGTYYQAPEMLIRMYHDAKTAEVISYQQARHFKAKYPLPNKSMYQADEKEQINFFLSEWLSFCQKEGLCSSASLAENLPTRTAA